MFTDLIIGLEKVVTFPKNCKNKKITAASGPQNHRIWWFAKKFLIRLKVGKARFRGWNRAFFSADYECGTNDRNFRQKISTVWRNIFGS
jgi:hypothetical protein